MMELAQPNVQAGVRWYRSRRFIIAMIIIGVIVIISGGFFGVSFAQASNLVKEADKLVQDGRYSEALIKYEKANHKFKFLKNKIGPKIARASEWQKESEGIKLAQSDYDAGNWQQCLDSTKEIKPDYPNYQASVALAAECQKKLDEVAQAAAAAAEAQAAAAQTAAGAGTASGSKTRSSSSTRSSSNSGQSVSSSDNGPTIGETVEGQSDSSSSSSSSDSSPSSSSSLASCSGTTYYTTSPVVVTDIASITPLGNFNPTAHTFPTDHIYFFLRQVGGVPVETTLYAPGDITITSVTASEHVTDGYTDYAFTFTPCTEITGTFGHVSSLSQDVLDKFNAASADSDSTYSTGGKTFHNVVKTISHTVSAGANIGTTGGRAGQYALDLTGIDTRTTLSFANNNRWQGNSRSIVCPLDYYSSGTKSTLTGLLGYYGTIRTVEPVCGEYEQDEPGTAQGVWLVAGTTSTYPEDAHLTLAHDNIEPNYGALSVGTTLSASGASSGVYYFTPTHSGTTNRDFDEVTSDGSVYCYEAGTEKGGSVSISFILQLTGNATLKIQKNSDGACGAGPWSFGGTANDFER